MMKNVKSKAMVLPAAASIAVAVLLTSSLSASAQGVTNQGAGERNGSLKPHRRAGPRPLTVRPAPAPAPVAAAVGLPFGAIGTRATVIAGPGRLSAT